MQPLEELTILLGANHNVHSAGLSVDHGSSRDADLGSEISAGSVGFGGNGGNAVVGVERVDRVMLGGDVDYVVHTKPRDVHARQIKRLSVRIPVGALGKELAELDRIDVGVSQD